MSICLDGRHAKDKQSQRQATHTLQTHTIIPKLG